MVNGHTDGGSAYKLLIRYSTVVYHGTVIKALIFDFDGTILDTETPDFVSWREVFSDHGAELTVEAFALGIGTGPATFDIYAHLASLTTRTVEVEAVRAVRHLRHDALLALETVRPGIEAWIADAQRIGLKLGIASSSPSEWVEVHTRRLGLRHAFSSIRGRDHVTLTKPAPELYLAVSEALGVRPSEAIAVEYSPNGVAAAKAAGLFCIAVPNSVTVALDLTAADLYVESLEVTSLADVIAYADSVI
jgi:HAD superfamily hydrolase (TIGR01509 family)